MSSAFVRVERFVFAANITPGAATEEASADEQFGLVQSGGIFTC